MGKLDHWSDCRHPFFSGAEGIQPVKSSVITCCNIPRGFGGGAYRPCCRLRSLVIDRGGGDEAVLPRALIQDAKDIGPFSATVLSTLPPEPKNGGIALTVRRWKQRGAQTSAIINPPFHLLLRFQPFHCRCSIKEFILLSGKLM